MNVQLKGICKSFSKKSILKDVDLLIESGKIVCLLGPSGSGKTTLIRVLTGALKADSGSVYVGDISMPSIKVIKKIGFMPQSDSLYVDISGMDNLMFFGRMFGMKSEQAKARSVELLNMLDLTDSSNKLVSTYSGGMKKRLSLAISLIHEPELLVLDEPTVGIDPMLRKVIWEEFHRLQKQNKTILVSTHVMDEVKQCDNAALLYNGIIIESDKIDVLLDKTEAGNIEELFIKYAEGVNA